MCKVNVSDFFDGGLCDALTNATFVEEIADDAFTAAHHLLYAVYSGLYKIEFCFAKDGVLQYVMVEEHEIAQENDSHEFEVRDDMHLFSLTLEQAAAKLNVQPPNEPPIKMGTAELHFEEARVASIYYFPSRVP